LLKAVLENGKSFYLLLPLRACFGCDWPCCLPQVTWRLL